MLAAKHRNRDIEGPIHRAVIDYLRLALPGAVIHHPAAEVGISGANIARAIARNKFNGMLVGFPDIIAFWHGGCLVIEVKAPKGVTSPAQVECHERLSGNGFPVHIVRSVDEAANAVAAFLTALPKMAAIELRGVVR